MAIVNKFREYSVFDNLMINQLCDELATVLVSEDEDFPHRLMLTGGAAYALQREPLRDLENIIFRVTHEADYFILLDYLDRISTKEMIKYGNRTYFKFSAGSVEVFFMIMYDAGYETVKVTYNGINLESVDFINPELL